MGAWQEALSELPPIPLFLAVGMPVLLVLAALLFLGRRAGWLGFLRASLRAEEPKHVAGSG